MSTISSQKKERNRRRLAKVAQLISDGEWYSIYDIADEIEESVRVTARIIMRLNTERKSTIKYGRYLSKYRLKRETHAS